MEISIEALRLPSFCAEFYCVNAKKKRKYTIDAMFHIYCCCLYLCNSHPPLTTQQAIFLYSIPSTHICHQRQPSTLFKCKQKHNLKLVCECVFDLLFAIHNCVDCSPREMMYANCRNATVNHTSIQESDELFASQMRSWCLEISLHTTRTAQNCAKKLVAVAIFASYLNRNVNGNGGVCFAYNVSGTQPFLLTVCWYYWHHCRDYRHKYYQRSFSIFRIPFHTQRKTTPFNAQRQLFLWTIYIHSEPIQF